MVTFVAFLTMVLGFVPTEAQRIICAVLFDGEPVPDSPLGAKLFGGTLGEISDVARRVAVLLKGARIGGTLLGSYRLLHLALTVPLKTLAPGELASAIIVAPDLRLARQALRYALGVARSVASINRCIIAETATSFTIRRRDGREIIIECLPATAGGSALRGRTLVGVLMSEAAFFRDADFVVNDAEIFRAVAPRVVPEGQIIIESTPWSETGIVFSLFSASYAEPKNAIACHAPTLTVRPELAEFVATEEARDPENAQREFGAEFLAAGLGVFFDPSAIDRCVRPELVLPLSLLNARYAAGADFAFESDSSALVVAARTGEILTAVSITEQRPERGKPLIVSEVVKTFADRLNFYGLRHLTADAHYRQAVREHLSKHQIGFVDAPPGANGKADTYLALRELVNAGQLQIPSHPRLIAQLKAIISKPRPGGGLSIFSPRRRGASGHGDLVSGLVLAAAGVRANTQTHWGRQGGSGGDPPIGGSGNRFSPLASRGRGVGGDF